MNEMQTHRDATLKQLAKTVASLQSFNYDTFDAARESVNIDGAEYVFDKLSLCGYAHNLSARDYRTFGEYLCQFLEEDRSSDDMRFYSTCPRTIRNSGARKFLKLSGRISCSEIPVKLALKLHD